jgi:hypothetical protein
VIPFLANIITVKIFYEGVKSFQKDCVHWNR